MSRKRDKKKKTVEDNAAKIECSAVEPVNAVNHENENLAKKFGF